MNNWLLHATRVLGVSSLMSISIDVNHILAIVTNLDEAFLLTHHYGNLADLTGQSVLMMNFFLEYRVHLVTLPMRRRSLF
jgi:hypothetical protein